LSLIAELSLPSLGTGGYNHIVERDPDVGLGAGFTAVHGAAISGRQ